jgi:histidinol dehydrogenase
VTPKLLKTGDDIDVFLSRLEQRMPGEDHAVRDAVLGIIADVRTHGSKAVKTLRARFEGVDSNASLVIRPQDDAAMRERLAASAQKVAGTLRDTIGLAIQRVRDYHRIQCDGDRVFKETVKNDQNTSRELGQFVSRVQPLDRVAVYVPGGKAFYPSSLVMSAVPAQVAGVREVVVVTPYRSLDNPAFAATCLDLGINEILATGGAQGVAAAAFGFEGFGRCDKIVGPGNAYVATAKHLLSGRIGIDGFAGPSEVLVLGDGTSPAEWVVADLLAQAEHDEEAAAILVTTSEREALAVADGLAEGLRALGDREDIAAESWRRYGAIILVPTEDHLVQLANRIHAEHLHIHTASALSPDGRERWAAALRGVGAVFFGRHTAEVFGDYLAGPSHVLPTAGTARFASPLGVYDFVRRSSLLWMTAELAADLAEATGSFADAEQLWGHARSARFRSRAEALKGSPC